MADDSSSDALILTAEIVASDMENDELEVLRREARPQEDCFRPSPPEG